MIYKLAPHVTEEMLVQEGFEIQERIVEEDVVIADAQSDELDFTTIVYPRCAVKDEIYIPLEDSEYGNRVIQDDNYGTNPEAFEPERIEDLIAKGMVICE